MERGPFRSPLARAIGLGSAKKGAQHWFAERLTAVALVPLSLWFVADAHTFAKCFAEVHGALP